jgi:hypothetical protein
MMLPARRFATARLVPTSSLGAEMLQVLVLLLLRVLYCLLALRAAWGQSGLQLSGLQASAGTPVVFSW